MKMTKYHREALRRARKLIASGRQQFICHALDSIRFHTEVHKVERACVELKYEIAAYLGKYYSLEAWLRHNRFSGRDARADRLAWIDWMLAQDEL